MTKNRELNYKRDCESSYESGYNDGYLDCIFEFEFFLDWWIDENNVQNPFVVKCMKKLTRRIEEEFNRSHQKI